MPDPDGPDTRIGHEEREQAIEVLKDAAGDGRLTLGELEERIDATLRSRTKGDLRDVLADLVPQQVVSAMLDPQPTAAYSAPGFTWNDPLVLRATWDDLVRRGAWEVPPFLETHTIAGTIRLDFTAASMLAPVTDIAHLGGAGDLVLVVPPDFGVNTDRVTGGLGRVKNRVNPKAERGRPQLIVRGSLGLGDIKVRHPGSVDRWLQDRTLRRSRG